MLPPLTTSPCTWRHCTVTVGFREANFEREQPECFMLTQLFSGQYRLDQAEWRLCRVARPISTDGTCCRQWRILVKGEFSIRPGRACPISSYLPPTVLLASISAMSTSKTRPPRSNGYPSARTSRRGGKILKRPNSTLAGASDTRSPEALGATLF